MPRILITGGCGFVGSTLALRLKAENPTTELVCLDSFYRRGSELNAARLTEHGIRVVNGDVRDPAAFDLQPCSMVIDAAAEPSVMAGCGADVRYVVDTNLGGTINTLEFARKYGAAVLFLSTSRVYPVKSLRAIRLLAACTRFNLAEDQELTGISGEGVSEDFPLDGARTLYGATKLASEIMVGEYAQQFSLPTLINRCGVIAGPWQMGKVDQGVVALWTAAHHYGRPLTYIGYDGRQVRDVLHVDDLADLVIEQVSDRSSWCGGTYNVGGGSKTSVSLLELTDLVESVIGKTLAMSVSPDVREGDVPFFITDATRAKRRWNWEPTRSVETIIGDIAVWIEDNSELLRPILCGG